MSPGFADCQGAHLTQKPSLGHQRRLLRINDPRRSREPCARMVNRRLRALIGIRAPDETIRSEVKPFSTSSEVLRKRTPAINGPRSNNEVRSCGRSSSTQFTAKFSGPLCPECTSSQSIDGSLGAGPKLKTHCERARLRIYDNSDFCLPEMRLGS